MKPFLLLATRAHDEVADDEYLGFLTSGGLAPDELVRVRLEAEGMPEIDLDDYSGIIVGGSPFNASDAAELKSDVQLRVESDFGALMDRVIAVDFPFLGACYGIGLLSTHLGGVVDTTYSELAGPVRVTLTAEASADPLFAGLAPEFDAFVGHKEACSMLPPGAVLLATGAECPVQAFRIGGRVYATQFHPELTQQSILTRLRIYNDNGYYEKDSWPTVVETIEASSVTEPAQIVRRFVEAFGRE